jgi:hypothetical protein
LKKLLLVLLLTLFTFSLAACDLLGGEDLPLPDPDPECETNQTLIDGVCVDNDITPPVFTGVEDVEIYVGSTFDPLEGITATDDVDGDITADIVVTGVVDPDTIGTYFLRYSIEDSAGNLRQATRYVYVVLDPSLIGDEMVPNGDFSLGWAVWSATTGLEGGNATYEVINEELKVTITGVAGGLWEPRLENQGITFEQGQAYRVSFDARAEAPRAIHVQIGELLDGPPYFTNFKPGQTEIFDLTTTMQTFTFDFVMGLETNENGGIFFEMGTVPMEDGTNGTLLTVVYLDNVVIEPIDSFEDMIDPVIDGAIYKRVEVGSTFDPLEGVTATDNVDGDITANIQVTGTVDTATPGDYVLTYTVSDAAGNSVTVERTINVREVQETSGLPADYGWRTFVNDWEGSVASIEVVDGVLVFTAENIANMTESWKMQVIQDQFAIDGLNDNEGSIQFEAGKTYRLTFQAAGSVAGDIKVAIGHSVGSWTPYHEETVSITTDLTEYTVVFTLDQAEVDYSVLAQLKFELGLFFAGQTGPQEFHLDNVLIEVLGEDGTTYTDAGLVLNGTFEKQIVMPSEPEEPVEPMDPTWVGYGTFTVVETETEATISYSGIDGAAWWDSNAQLPIVNFDGTKGSIIFTFTGVDGHEYLFKVEGPEGVARELGITGNGLEQTLEIDLSTLTEAQRASLNLIIVFVQTDQAAGDIVIQPWTYGAEVEVGGPTQLTTPFGIVVQPTQVVWGAIPEASGFKVYIDGVTGSPFDVAAGTYAFNIQTLDLQPGTYDIRVQAIGDNVSTSDSEISAIVQHVVSSDPVQLQTPFGVVIQPTGEMVWGALPEASGFEVVITGVTGSPFSVAAGVYTFDLAGLGLAPGSYDVQLRAIGDDVDYLDSELTAVFTYVVE